MAVFVPYVVCIILAYGIVQIKALSWLSTPGTVRACVGGDAAFRWHYDATSTDPVTFYQWQYVTKGVTVLQRHVRQNGDDTLTYYDYGRDRVGLADPSVANAGIILKQLVKSDQGAYLVRITGGVTDTANLQIYSEDELEPTLEIDNSPVEFGTTYNMSECTRCVIVISTAKALVADISITTSIPSNPIECKSKTTCSKLINLSRSGHGSFRITFRLDYGFCSVKEKYIDVVWLNTGGDPVEGEPNQTDDGNGSGVLTLKWEFILGMCLAVLAIIVIGLCVVICVLFKWVRRKQKEDVKQMPRHQRTILGAANRWQAIAKSSRANLVLRSRSRTPKTDLDPSDIELGTCIIDKTEESPEDNNKSNEELANRDSPEGKDTDDPMVDPDPCIIHVDDQPIRGQGDGIPVDIGTEVKEDSDEFKRQESSDSVLNDFVVIPPK